VLLADKAYFGAEIVQRLGHGLPLEFDHIGRPGVANGFHQAIEPPFDVFDARGQAL
jgi:hypothetical protein